MPGQLWAGWGAVTQESSFPCEILNNGTHFRHQFPELTTEFIWLSFEHVPMNKLFFLGVWLHSGWAHSCPNVFPVEIGSMLETKALPIQGCFQTPWEPPGLRKLAVVLRWRKCELSQPAGMDNGAAVVDMSNKVIEYLGPPPWRSPGSSSCPAKEKDSFAFPDLGW